MLSEAFTELGKLLKQATIEMDQHHEELHRNFLWVLCERFDFLPKSLLKLELIVVGY